MPPVLSFVMPTYNRRDILPAAIDSALVWLDRIGCGEIIVVDDGSSDATAEMMSERYGERQASGQLVFHERERNGGAAAAKNSGAILAKGEWIVFLDSDDMVIADAVLPVLAQLETAGDASAVLFRCVERSSGALVGSDLGETVAVDLPTDLAFWKWGECLPAVRADCARRFPYVVDLPGYEGISYARMSCHTGRVLVSPIVARIYDTGDHERVSTPAPGLRSLRQRKFSTIMLSEFRDHLSLRARLRFCLTYIRAQVELLTLRKADSLR